MNTLRLFSCIAFFLGASRLFAYTPQGDADVVFWLDAADSSTLFQNTGASVAVTGDGQPVGAWLDKSGSGWNVLANGGDAGKPTFKASQQHGLPAIRFDGTSDSMSTAVASLQGSSYTIFVVAKRMAQQGLESLLSIHDSGSPDWNNTGSICLGLGYEGTLADVRNGQFQSLLSHPGNGVSFMFTTKYDGTNNTAYVNGVGAAPVGSSGNLGAETITLGARGAGLGDLNRYEYFEVLIYSSALTDQKRQEVENYLGTKYAFANTQWAPPPPAPPQLPNGPYNPQNDSRVVFWLDAADTNTLFQNTNGTTPVTAEGQPVGTWRDKSGKGWHVTANGGDAGRPTYKAGQQNGIGAIRFDGNSDSLSTHLASLDGSAYTIFVVAKRGAQRNQEALLSIHNSGSLDWDNSGSTCVGFGYGEILADARNHLLQSQLSHPGSGTSFMYATKYDGTNNTAYVNGVGAAPVASNGTFSAETITLGARNPALGDLNRYDYLEVLIYDFALSDPYRQAVETYLGSKYALPNTQWAPPPPPPPQPPTGPYVPEDDSRLVFWLDATDVNTLFQDTAASVPVTANGQPIGAWLDKSGNNWHVAANGGVNGKPVYRATQQTAIPSVRFDGSSDSMSTHIASLQGSAHTIVVVGKRVSHRPFEAMLSVHAEGTLDWNDSRSVCVGYSDGTVLADARESALRGNATHPGNGLPFMYMSVYDGVNNKVYVNGVAGNSAASTKRLSAETITLGARSVHLTDNNNYDYYEVLIYDFAFSDAYRQAVEEHLGSKYEFPNSQWAPPPPPPPVPPVGPYNPAVDTHVALWLDSSDSSTLFRDVTMTTPVTADGQLLGAWTDKSANGWHFRANGGEGGKPLYKINQQNGKPSIRFDGNSDSITTTLASLQSSAYTVFVVGKRLTYRPLEAVMSIHSAETVDWNSTAAACIGYSDGKKIVDVRNSSLMGQVDHPSAGVTFLYSSKYDGVAGTSYVNGRSGTPVSMPGAFGANRITLGARGANLTNFNNYEYFEVLVFDFAMSDEYRTAVERYLEAKYAIENMAGTVPNPAPSGPPAPPGSYTPAIDSRVTFWLDAADNSTLFQDLNNTVPATTNGQPVAVWKDKSAKGWHVSVAGGNDANRPTIKTDDGGHKSIRFDGIANFLRTNAASLQGSSYTFFVVSKRSAFVNLEAMLSIHDAGAPDWENNFSVCLGHNVFFEQHQNFMGDCRTDILLSETAHPGDDVTFIFGSKYNGTSNWSYINGVAGAPAPSSGVFSAETITLGARNTNLDHFNKYDYYEVLIFDCALTDSHREAVETYLRTKYSIPQP